MIERSGWLIQTEDSLASYPREERETERLIDAKAARIREKTSARRTMPTRTTRGRAAPVANRARGF